MKENKCVGKCGDNWVDKNNKECDKCFDSNCLKCEKNNLYFCVECISPYFFIKNGVCVIDCGEGYTQEQELEIYWKHWSRPV